MKKFLATVLSAILILTATATYALDNCSDWAFEYINTASSFGIIPNELNTKYTEDITRLEFVQLAINTFIKANNTDIVSLASKASSEVFDDTNDIYVSAASSLGIISGAGDGRFYPDNKLTRQEAAKILFNIYAVSTNDYSPTVVYQNKYKDYSDISDWAKPYVASITSMSVMNGISDNTFAPLNNYTVEQCIATCVRLYNHIINTTQAPPDANNQNPEITSMLKVDSGYLSDGSRQIVLNGINLGGWLLMEEWMAPVAFYQDSAYSDIIDTLISRFGEYRAAELIKSYENNFITALDFKIIEALGFNCVRIPFWYKNFVDSNGNIDTNSSGFKHLDTALELCQKHGIYAILDMHGCPGGQSMNHSTGLTAKNELYTSEKNLKLMEKIWVAIATRYRDNNCVAAYDIMNEPQNNGDYTGATAWKAESDDAVKHTNAVYDRMIKAIRKADPNHIITVEGIWTTDVLPNPADYNWTNMLYQLHIYDTTTDMINKRINELLQVRSDYGVAVLVGEYNSKSLERYASEKYSVNNISRVKWTYKTIDVSYDDWGLFDKKYDKINLRTASYDEIKSAFENDIRTENGFIFNIKEYNMIRNK